MRRTLIGGAVLGASLVLGAGPALACGHPGHHHKPAHHVHKPREHKPRHEHHGKPCVCHKPKPPCHKPHHHKPVAKPPVVHPRPPVITPPGHAVKPPTARRVAHTPTQHVTTVSYATPATLPRTGGTPWVLIFGGGVLITTGTALTLASGFRKASERAS